MEQAKDDVENNHAKRCTDTSKDTEVVIETKCINQISNQTQIDTHGNAFDIMPCAFFIHKKTSIFLFSEILHTDSDSVGPWRTIG